MKKLYTLIALLAGMATVSDVSAMFGRAASQTGRVLYGQGAAGRLAATPKVQYGREMANIWRGQYSSLAPFRSGWDKTLHSTRAGWDRFAKSAKATKDSLLDATRARGEQMRASVQAMRDRGLRSAELARQSAAQRAQYAKQMGAGYVAMGLATGGIVGPAYLRSKSIEKQRILEKEKLVRDLVSDINKIDREIAKNEKQIREDGNTMGKLEEELSSWWDIHPLFSPSAMSRADKREKIYSSKIAWSKGISERGQLYKERSALQKKRDSLYRKN